MHHIDGYNEGEVHEALENYLYYRELSEKLLRWYVHWLNKSRLTMDDRTKHVVNKLGLKKDVAVLKKELTEDEPYDEEKMLETLRRFGPE